MDIPICKGDLCYCVDVLDALTKDFFARKGNPVEETAELGEVTAHTDRPGYEPISSTLWRQREDYCARMIQSAWRRRSVTNAGGGSVLNSKPSGSRLDDFNEEDEYEEESEEEEADDSDDNDNNETRRIADTSRRRLMPSSGAGVSGANREAVTVVVHSRSSSVSSGGGFTTAARGNGNFLDV